MNSFKQYIGVSINGTYTNFVFTTTVPDSPWYYNGTTMVIIIDGAAYGIGSYKKNGTLYKSISASPSYYSNYFVKFELEETLTAEAFATTFLDSITCDSTGATPPTFTKTWSELKALYNTLDDTEKAKLLGTSESTVINNAMARYDYIIGKYGTATYEDFIGRNPAPLSVRGWTINPLNETSVIPAIIIVSIAAITTIGVIITLKKKKVN